MFIGQVGIMIKSTDLVPDRPRLELPLCHSPESYLTSLSFNCLIWKMCVVVVVGGQDKHFKVIDSLECCVDKQRQSMKSLSVVLASTCRSLVGVSCFHE